ncbi:hypothetical protein ASG89_02040 [Paenibacillus sp. Soil766]|uniref:hypothetical protein n=1 Tax=Paenibacillus sp. Soil766 TaxID=1736404 RepID=UPI00070F7B1F|nr:hypothetical protein [Paenibacillus sp. Soil766]KRF03572.1 hypothetical protein ASG89_02040 [Paenibacillus sp. Soil766]
MKASSKWTKWQIGFVSAMIVVYLFQEVKESPEFLTAVREASNAKLNTTAVIAQKSLDMPPSEAFSRNSNNRIQRSGSSRDQVNQSEDSSSQSLPQSQQSNQTKTHTRSHAS